MKPLILPKRLLVAFAGFGFAMWIGGIMNLKNHYDSSNLMLYIGLILQLIAIVCITVDIFRNNVYRKYLWIMSLLLFAGVAALVYLVKRK